MIEHVRRLTLSWMHKSGGLTAFHLCCPACLRDLQHYNIIIYFIGFFSVFVFKCSLKFAAGLPMLRLMNAERWS